MLRVLLSLLAVIAAMGTVAALHRSEPGPLDPGLGKSIIDMHVHVAGLGYGDSGAFVNERMRRDVRFPVFLRAMGVSEKELEAHGDHVLFERLSTRIAASRTVAKAVVLALDGYVTHAGVLDRTRTPVYVPNDYVARQTARFDNLLFGASVNPNRGDAIARLRQVKRDGAWLVKWIPSIMNIDPADPRHIPFYRALAELDLPLLSHTGMERSFPGARNELADPLRLRLALEQGVTVIAAHIATTGHSAGEDNFARILPLFQAYPNLYTDISSLTQINKTGYLAHALRVAGLTDRMLYGSDWPLQFFPVVSPWYHLRHIDLAAAWRVSGIENPWDRDVALKAAFGVPDSVFERSASLLEDAPGTAAALGRR